MSKTIREQLIEAQAEVARLKSENRELSKRDLTRMMGTFDNWSVTAFAGTKDPGVTVTYKVPRQNMDALTTLLRQTKKDSIHGHHETPTYVDGLESAKEDYRNRAERAERLLSETEAQCGWYRARLEDIKQLTGSARSHPTVQTIAEVNEISERALQNSHAGKGILSEIVKMNEALEEKRVEVAAELLRETYDPLG